MSRTSTTVRPPETLEDELAQLLRIARLSERQARAVSTRLGWDGQGATTLQVAATAEGYSRERVRQLEGLVRERLARTLLQVPRIEAAVELVEAAAPDSRVHIAHRLAQSGVTASPFDPAGVLSAADVMGVTARAATRHGLVLLRPETAPDDAAIRLARRLTRRQGATNVDELARELASTPGRVRRMLRLRPEVKWFDDGELWLYVPRANRRAVSNLRKMFSLSPSLTVDEANEGMRRAFRPVVIPAEILCAVCESLPWLVVAREEQTIATKVPLSPAAELSPLEQQLVALFQAAGPVLTYVQATDLGTRAGLNRNTVAAYLGRSPLIKTVERGRYALRGA